MAQWFVVRDSEEQGPFTGAQLKELASAGKLHPDDLVRRDDMQGPRGAGTIKGLFPADGRSSSASFPAPPASLSEASGGDLEKAKKTGSKKPLMILSAVAGAFLLLCCGGCGVVFTIYTIEKRAAQRELAEADGLWQSGDKAAAATKYRALLQSKSKRNTLKGEQEAIVYGRVIDFEVESGNMESAKQLLAEAGRRKVTPTLHQPKAKALVAAQQASGAPPGGRAPDGPKGDGLTVAPSGGRVPDKPKRGGLTADFLPCFAGNVKRYEEQIYDPVNGRVLVFAEDRETYGKDNTLTVERTIKSPGAPSSRLTYRGERREADGYVEHTNTDNLGSKVLSIRVKLGANPGADWPDGRGEGKYRLIRFDKTTAQGAKGPYELIQALIEHRWEVVDGRGDRTVNITEIVLEREGGIQSEKSYMLIGGQKKLIRHKRLISSTY